MRRFSIGLVAGFLAFAALLSLAHAQMPVVPEAQTAQGVFEPYGPGGLSVNTVQVVANASGTTLATTATMPAVAAKTNYLCGFDVEGDATTPVIGTIGVTGLIGPGVYSMFFTPASGSANVNSAYRTFTPCVPASAVNTAILVNASALGIGGNVTISIWGFVR